MTITVEFTCSRDGHPSRVLRRIDLAADGAGSTPNEIALNRLSVNLWWDSKRRGDRVSDLKVERLAGELEGDPTVLPFACPTCRLNRQIKYVDLVTVIEKLHAAGVSSVDVSAIPTNLGSS